MPNLEALKEEPKPAPPKREKLTQRNIAGLPIRPARDLPTNYNMLIYGDPKLGKSTLAASAHEVPSLAPVLVVDIEAGGLTLKHAQPDVDTVQVPTWHKLVEVYQGLVRDDYYRTVVIDNLSEANKLAMMQIIAEGVQESGRDRDPDVAELRDWGKGNVQTTRLVRFFRDLPKNVIFVAWAVTDKDENNRRFTAPLLPGKLSKEIPGYLDIVLYMYKKDIRDEAPKRYVLTAATERIVAGDRTNKLPQVVEDPTMLKLWAHIETGDSK